MRVLPQRDAGISDSNVDLFAKRGLDIGDQPVRVGRVASLGLESLDDDAKLLCERRSDLGAVFRRVRQRQCRARLGEGARDGVPYSSATAGDEDEF